VKRKNADIDKLLETHPLPWISVPPEGEDYSVVMDANGNKVASVKSYKKQAVILARLLSVSLPALRKMNNEVALEDQVANGQCFRKVVEDE